MFRDKNEPRRVMDAWSEVGPASNLNLNGKKKRKREEKYHIFFSPFWAISDNGVRERKKRNSSFSLRSTEIEWSESVEPRFKVHLFDKGLRVGTDNKKFFVEDFLFGKKKLEREAPPSL